MRLRPGYARGDARRDHDAEFAQALHHVGRLALTLLVDLPHARGWSTAGAAAARHVRELWPSASPPQRAELRASAERAGLSEGLKDILKPDGI